MQQVLLAGGAAPFGPLTLSGCSLWLKADAITGLASSDPVSTWPDSSGNGRNATGSGTVRPLWISGAINSLPIVRFDGVNDVLVTAAIPLNSFKTGFILVKSGNLNFSMILGSSNSGTIYGIYAEFNITDHWQMRAPGGADDMGAMSTSVFKQFSTVNGYNTNEAFGIGGRAAGSSYCAADLAEMILYDSVLSSPNIALVQGYLLAKYGV